MEPMLKEAPQSSWCVHGAGVPHAQRHSLGRVCALARTDVIAHTRSEVERTLRSELGGEQHCCEGIWPPYMSAQI